MKYFFTFFLSLFFFLNSYAQKSSHKYSREYNDEYIASAVLLLGGSVTASIGGFEKIIVSITSASAGGTFDDNTGNGLLIAGGLFILSGAVLYFDAIGKEKRRFAVRFNSMYNPTHNSGKIYSSYMPAVLVSIPLNR